MLVNICVFNLPLPDNFEQWRSIRPVAEAMQKQCRSNTDAICGES